MTDQTPDLYMDFGIPPTIEYAVIGILPSRPMGDWRAPNGKQRPSRHAETRRAKRRRAKRGKQ